MLILAVALIVPQPRKAGLSVLHSNLAEHRCTFCGLPLMTQEADSDENEVSTQDVEKYVSVYKAMQRNRNMTIDQATAAQGLTTRQFRELENRVQRDDAALQQARDELQTAARKGSGQNRPLSSP